MILPHYESFKVVDNAAKELITILTQRVCYLHVSFKLRW